MLLGKKCLALRIASVQARDEKWLAEHMLILGIEEPDGPRSVHRGGLPQRVRQDQPGHAASPEGSDEGLRIWTVGDDIAWMKVGADGRLWAVNPEMGYFGVVPGTNSKTNSNAMATITHDTIYTNVALKPDGTAWWEGHEPPPAERTRLAGQAVETGREARTASRITPNSTLHRALHQLPHPFVPLRPSPRRAHLGDHLRRAARHLRPAGLRGARLGSRRLRGREHGQRAHRRAIGAVGEVRRDPMAMLPFCGYNMADYFGHWLTWASALASRPRSST